MNHTRGLDFSEFTWTAISWTILVIQLENQYRKLRYITWKEHVRLNPNQQKSNHANAYASPFLEQAGMQYFQYFHLQYLRKKTHKLTQAYLMGKALPAWSLPAKPSEEFMPALSETEFRCGKTHPHSTTPSRKRTPIRRTVKDIGHEGMT